MKLSLIALALSAAALSSACNKPAVPPAPGAGTTPAATAAVDSSPAVAKVNGIEIHQAQIGTVLARVGNIPADKVKETSKQVLDKLIEEEVIVQQAEGIKLEADPKVIQALQAARKEILLRAYLEQATAKVDKPGEFEVKDYYAKNPALFKERKIYNLRELQIQAKPDVAPKLQEVVTKAKSLEEVAAWLKSQNLTFNVSTATKPAEQLPPELLARFAAMKDGQIMVLNTGSVLLVEQLGASRPLPVDEAAAKPAIERLLTGQKRSEAATKEVKLQREKAKIEYLGEYAGSAPTPPARPN